MARVESKRKIEKPPQTPLEMMMHEHLNALRVKNYSGYTIRTRQVAIQYFIEWAEERGLNEPLEITRPMAPIPVPTTIKLSPPARNTGNRTVQTN